MWQWREWNQTAARWTPNDVDGISYLLSKSEMITHNLYAHKLWYSSLSCSDESCIRKKKKPDDENGWEKKYKKRKSDK